MAEVVKTKYSDDKEFYYEISLREDGNYEVSVFKKIVYDDYCETIVTYHEIQDRAHITDTEMRAIEIGDEILIALAKENK